MSSTQENIVNLGFPLKVSLNEEEKFLAQIRQGEIKLYRNEEVLAELAKMLKLK